MTAGEPEKRTGSRWGQISRWRETKTLSCLHPCVSIAAGPQKMPMFNFPRRPKAGVCCAMAPSLRFAHGGPGDAGRFAASAKPSRRAGQTHPSTNADRMWTQGARLDKKPAKKLRQEGTKIPEREGAALGVYARGRRASSLRWRVPPGSIRTMRSVSPISPSSSLAHSQHCREARCDVRYGFLLAHLTHIPSLQPNQARELAEWPPGMQ